MNNFEPIGAKVTFAPLIYYKITIISLIKMFTIYDDETYGQKGKAHICCTLSLCWWALNGVTKQ